MCVNKTYKYIATKFPRDTETKGMQGKEKIRQKGSRNMSVNTNISLLRRRVGEKGYRKKGIKGKRK